MADEIALTKTLRLNNGALARSWSSGNILIDQSVARMYSNTQVIGFAAEEVIAVGSDISTLGICTLKNLDSANYVDWGPESGGSMVVAGTLKAGEEFTFRLKPGVTYRAQANTAAVTLSVDILND